jgi:hypothetical protein
MAITGVPIQVLRSVGAEDYRITKVTGDTAYPTGGYPITPALFGFSAFANDGIGNGIPPTVGYYSVVSDLVNTPYSVINPANGNLQLFVTATNVEVANGTTAAGYSACLSAFGH